MAKDPFGGISREEYYKRLEKVQANLKRLPYGSRMRAALEMGMNPSIMYQVTNARATDLEVLELIEEWVGGELTRVGEKRTPMLDAMVAAGDRDS